MGMTRLVDTVLDCQAVVSRDETLEGDYVDSPYRVTNCPDRGGNEECDEGMKDAYIDENYVRRHVVRRVLQGHILNLHMPGRPQALAKIITLANSTLDALGVTVTIRYLQPQPGAESQDIIHGFIYNPDRVIGKTSRDLSQGMSSSVSEEFLSGVTSAGGVMQGI
jgi:hypothetical protein